SASVHLLEVAVAVAVEVEVEVEDGSRSSSHAIFPAGAEAQPTAVNVAVRKRIRRIGMPARPG
ncbi:MAG TPA: hypothetical protein VF400_15925, partial [Anaeromyxobacteraceae bacterium]